MMFERNERMKKDDCTTSFCWLSWNFTDEPIPFSFIIPTESLYKSNIFHDYTNAKVGNVSGGPFSEWSWNIERTVWNDNRSKAHYSKIRSVSTQNELKLKTCLWNSVCIRANGNWLEFIQKPKCYMQIEPLKHRRWSGAVRVHALILNSLSLSSPFLSRLVCACVCRTYFNGNREEDGK